MYRSGSRFVVTLVSTLAIPLLAITMLLPGVASASSTPPAVKGACTQLSGNAESTSGPDQPTISGCSPAANLSGPATFTFPFANKGKTTIHWSNGSTTTFSFSTKLTYPTSLKKGVTVANPKFKCPLGDFTEAALKGKIPNRGGNANLPPGDTGVKGTVKATVCVTATFDISLLSGTTWVM